VCGELLILGKSVIRHTQVAILSTLALVAAGTLAALLPAIRAVRTDPAIALREEW
jgi:ABC-type antimicrobial peptide transport system permease subunit